MTITIAVVCFSTPVRSKSRPLLLFVDYHYNFMYCRLGYSKEEFYIYLVGMLLYSAYIYLKNEMYISLIFEKK